MKGEGQRPQIAFKVPWEVFHKLEEFKAKHPMIAASKIYSKALDYYLNEALPGVDTYLNPVHKKR